MNTTDRPRDLNDDFDVMLRNRLGQLAADTQTSTPGDFDPDAVPMTSLAMPEARRWTLVAAAAIAVVGVGGVLAISDRPAPADLTPATAPGKTALESPSPTAAEEPDDRGLETLLYPGTIGGAATATTIAAPGGRAAGSLISPTGNLFSVNMMENFWGSVPAELEQRTIGTISFAAGTEDGLTAYTALNTCSMIGIGNRSPAFQPWSAEATQLLEATDFAGSNASISVPAGWTSLGAGSLGVIYELHFDASATNQEVTMWQMPDTPIGTLLSQFSRGSALETTIGGTPAWLLQGTDGDPYNYLAWDASGTAAMVGLPHGDEAQLQSIASSLRVGHATDWANALNSQPGAAAADASAQEAESGNTIAGSKTDPANPCGTRPLTISG